MLKLIINQTNWGIIGSLFGFSIGFIVKVYIIDIVGISDWGKYISAHTLATAFDTFLSLGIPIVLLKFLPEYLKKNTNDFHYLIRRSLIYAFMISVFFMILFYFLAPYFDKYLYTEIDSFSFILLLVSAHVPIAIFTGIIASLYRSIFKIKDLIIYGTFIAVPLRAILTLIIFKFTDNIIYFVVIELFTTSLSFGLLFYFFNKNEFLLFNLKPMVNKLNADVISYGKKVYANSLATFFGYQSLALILSIMLPPNEIGVYSILITITGLSLFLIQNLNKIFAPIISKLYEEDKIHELSQMYKQTTFIVNLITIPFVILIMYFSKELLLLFDNTGDILSYLPYLHILMLARVIALISGSSGTIMLMAGLEKKELLIQTIKAISLTSLALLFTEEYGFPAIIILFILFTLFINFSQLFYINKLIKINPFSKNLFMLLLLSGPFAYYAIIHEFKFNILQLLIVPISLYLIYFIFFFKSLRSFYFSFLVK